MIKINFNFQPKYTKKCSLWHLLGSKSPKKDEKMLDIMGEFWGVLRVCDTFWVQNHTWLLVKKFGKRDFSIFGTCDKITIDYQTKKLEKILVVTPFGFIIPQKSRKNARYYGRVLWGLEYLWHLLDSKWQLIIGQKNWKNMSICGTCNQNNSRLTAKKLETMLFVTPFGFKTH